MGGDMSKICQGVYIGSYGNAANEDYLDKHNVTHVLAVHNLSEEAHKKHKKTRVNKRINISDINMENINKYFSECNDFIHEARLSGGNCLIHCQVGISRSVTITCAYLMSVTSFNFHNSLRAIQGSRVHACPNMGFRDQLLNFEKTWLEEERQKMKNKFGESPFRESDELELARNIEALSNRENEPISVNRQRNFIDRIKDTMGAGTGCQGGPSMIAKGVRRVPPSRC